MPDSNELKRLNKILMLYSKAILPMRAEFREIANTFETLIYINSSIAFVKKYPNVLAEKMLALLLKSFDAIKSYDVMYGEIDETLYNNLLLDLNNTALVLFDLLPPEKRKFRMIKPLLNRLPNYVFQRIDIPISCLLDVSKLFKGRALKMPTIIGYSSYSINTQLSKINNPKHPDNNANIDKLSQHFEQSSVDPFSLDDNALSDDDCVKALVIILNTAYAPDFQCDFNVLQCIRTLYLHPQVNKEKFAALFLKGYQQSYNLPGYQFTVEQEQRDTKMLNALFNFYLPLLDEYLPAKKLSALMLQLITETSFFLENPDISKEVISRSTYETYMPFYMDIAQGNLEYSFAVPDRLHVSRLQDQLVYGQYFATSLKIAGKNAADSLQCLDSEIFVELPIIHQTELVKLFEKNPALQAEYESFLTLFLQVNAQAHVDQRQDFTLFFFKHNTAIIQLIYIMGTEGIRYFRSHLAYTVLPLDRILTVLPTLSEEAQNRLASYFLAQNLTWRANPQAIENLKSCIIILDLLFQLPDFDTTIYNALSPKNLPETCLKLFVTELLNKIFQGIQLRLTPEEINKIVQNIDTQKIVSLIAASQHMSNNEYRDVYLHLLLHDLTQGNIHHFLHTTDESNEAGKNLAAHNLRIKNKLVMHHIEPESALNYERTLNFSVSLDSKTTEINPEAATSTLLSYIQQLNHAINSISISDRENTQLSQLLERINLLLSPLATSSEMSKKTHGKLYSDLILLEKYKELLPDHINEFSEHVRTQYQSIKESKKHAISSSYQFTVKQWNKSDPETFFLGDHVGCCLATNNAQFQAMVQRRMDDAAIFHVAVDQKTQKPVALIWLYLAETTENKVVLIANFFEVNTKYAQDERLRLALLNGLLQFTHQYCEDNPNIHAFYMNQLKYGWNQHDLEDYSLAELALSDKLGGPYIPDMTPDEVEKLHHDMMTDASISENVKTYTQQKYYLVSLKETQFHRFDPKKLTLVNVIEATAVVEAPKAEAVSLGKIRHSSTFSSSSKNEPVTYSKFAVLLVTEHMQIKT
jgi:hypothetical protein